MLLQRIDFPVLDGEGIVPAFLVVFWVKEQLQAGYQNDQELKSILYTIITGAIKGELISAYYELQSSSKASAVKGSPVGADLVEAHFAKWPRPNLR